MAHVEGEAYEEECGEGEDARARGTVRAEAILNAVSAESPGAASVRPLLPFQQLLHGTAQGAGQAVEGYALGLVDVLLPLLV